MFENIIYKVSNLPMFSKDTTALESYWLTYDQINISIANYKMVSM